jgi:CRISPR system Cascade subunit CasB
MAMDSEKDKRTGRPDAFVLYVIELCKKDKGAAAALRRANNPATEYQSWEFLAAFSIDLENPFERIPYATIAAAIARTKPEKNGSIGIGKAIALCYDDRSASEQAKAKLRRLLACASTEEACRILRPLFSLVESRADAALDYARLLKQLTSFSYDDNKVKTQWASEFYHQAVANETVEVGE